MPAPKPPSPHDQDQHDNLMPTTPGGPDDDDDPSSPRAQALLDAFDEDANVEVDDSQDHAE